MPEFLRPKTARGLAEMACIPCLYACGFGVKTIARLIGWKNHVSVQKVLRRNAIPVLPRGKWVGLGRQKKTNAKIKVWNIDLIQEQCWLKEWPAKKISNHWHNHPVNVYATHKEKIKARAQERWKRMSKDQRAAKCARAREHKRQARMAKGLPVRSRRTNVSAETRRVQDNLRRRLKDIIKRIKHGGVTVIPRKETHCSTDTLKRWLESKFKRGMSWNNYGTEWHVDHIVPISSFYPFTHAQQRAANHYTNLQPMWARDNINKGNSMPSNHQPELVLSL